MCSHYSASFTWMTQNATTLHRYVAREELPAWNIVVLWYQLHVFSTFWVQTWQRQLNVAKFNVAGHQHCFYFPTNSRKSLSFYFHARKFWNFFAIDSGISLWTFVYVTLNDKLSLLLMPFACSEEKWHSRTLIFQTHLCYLTHKNTQISEIVWIIDLYIELLIPVDKTL